MRLVKSCVGLILLGLIWSCSPKLNKPSQKKSGQETNVNTTPAKPTPAKPAFTKARIALLLPFKLNQNDYRTATKAQLDRLDIALDYYQGFLLGIDSVSYGGLNFDINVYDTQDQAAKIKALQERAELKNAHVIVGPIFPEELKLFTGFSAQYQVPVVSPLAASNPAEYANPHLISMVNHLDVHAENIGKYIISHYKPESGVLVIINPKKPEDEVYASALKSYIKEQSPNLLIQEYTSINAFETRMVRGKQYAVAITSADRPFVAATLDKLQKIAKLKASDFSFQAFGHPTWMKQNYPVQTLQALKTIVSSAYHVDYKSSAVINFVKSYRAKFNFEPSEYAFKGYDLGVFIGKLLHQYGDDFAKHIVNFPYQGIQQHYNFSFDKNMGFYNTDLILLQYKNLSLQIVQ